MESLLPLQLVTQHPSPILLSLLFQPTVPCEVVFPFISDMILLIHCHALSYSMPSNSSLVFSLSHFLLHHVLVFITLRNISFSFRLDIFYMFSSFYCLYSIFYFSLCHFRLFLMQRQPGNESMRHTVKTELCTINSLVYFLIPFWTTLFSSSQDNIQYDLLIGLLSKAVKKKLHLIIFSLFYIVFQYYPCRLLSFKKKIKKKSAFSHLVPQDINSHIQFHAIKILPCSKVATMTKNLRNKKSNPTPYSS